MLPITIRTVFSRLLACYNITMVQFLSYWHHCTPLLGIGLPF
jgi:hypothetical protein